MKKETTIQIMAGLLILLFVYTALSKFTDFHKFSTTLSNSPLIGSKANYFKWIVPITELIVSVLLFIPRFRLYGLYAAFALMALFTLYVTYMVLFYRNLPCSCGGIVAKLSWTQHIFVNLAFTLLAFTGIKLEKRKSNEDRSAFVPA